MINKVVILMATYNGEKYLQQQLDSIINQSYNNWDMIIHDDGSTDNTQNIIMSYKEKYQDKIIIINDNIKNKSSKKNFLELIKYSIDKNYEYYLFADQDDIWEIDKLKILIQNAEKERKSTSLIIAFSDSIVIDSNNRVIANSFNEFSNLKMKRNDLVSVSLWNLAQGCSILISQNLLKEITKFDSQNIIMHDWFLFILNIILDGKIVFINKKLQKYRNHENNVIGGKKYKRIFDLLSLKKMNKYIKDTHEIYNKAILQVKEINKIYEIDSQKYGAFLKFLKKDILLNRILLCIKYNLFSKKSIKTCFGFIFLG